MMGSAPTGRNSVPSASFDGGEGSSGGGDDVVGVFWFRATAVQLGAGADVVGATDLDPLHQDLGPTFGGMQPPQLVTDPGGLPAIYFGDPVDSLISNPLRRASNMRYDASNDFADGVPRVVYSVNTPFSWAHGISSGAGGSQFQFRTQAQAVFRAMAYNWVPDGLFHAYENSLGLAINAATIAGYLVRQALRYIYDGSLLSLDRDVGGGFASVFSGVPCNPSDASALPGFYWGGTDSGPKGEMYANELRGFSGSAPVLAYESSLRAEYLS